MTIDADPLVGADPGAVFDHEPVRPAGGRMVSFRFIRLAVRRRRRLWLTVAAIGLLIGAGYHAVVPLKYSATATVYLAHPTGSDNTVEANNDLAILETPAVGARAIAMLGTRGLTPAGLLGKAPGTAASDNVLVITISGRSPSQAVRRVNAVAKAYLAFRAEQYDAQDAAVAAAADKQIAKLQAKVQGLTAQIDALGTGTSSQGLTNLVADRSAATTEITNLQQSVQQDNLSNLSVSQASRVITWGTAVHVSKVKVFGLDALSGLAAGLAIGLGFVIVQAIATDRLRSREDVAAVLGVPVGLSVEPIRTRRLGRRRSVRAIAGRSDPHLRALVQYLREWLTAAGPKPTGLLVSVDELRIPAAAVVALARTLAGSDKQVVLVDATVTRVLGRALGSGSVGSGTAELGGGRRATLLVAPRPWEAESDEDWEYHLGELASADAVLVLATVDPAVGAWHLRTWSSEALVTVRSGKSNAQQIGAVAELLAAADLTISSTVLLDADPADQSIGLPESGPIRIGRRLGAVPPGV